MYVVDTMDKIVWYFAAVTKEPFEYKGKTYHPLPLIVAPSLFQGFTCPAGCGGCCGAFTLDWLPDEERPYEVPARSIEFNHNRITLRSDVFRCADGARCPNLNPEGRCKVHGLHPFSCDFELIKVALGENLPRNWMGSKLYSRRWRMKRMDGTRGAMCEMLPRTKETTKEAIRKLRRLQEWTDHFGLYDTYLPDIIAWGESGRYVNSELHLPNTPKEGALF